VDSKQAAVHFWCSCSATPAVRYAARSQKHTCELKLTSYTHNKKLPSPKHACAVQFELAWTANKQQCSFRAPAVQSPQCTTTPRSQKRTREANLTHNNPSSVQNIQKKMQGAGLSRVASNKQQCKQQVTCCYVTLHVYVPLHKHAQTHISGLDCAAMCFGSTSQVCSCLGKHPLHTHLRICQAAFTANLQA
jgi:hypothetical protein